jgi:23S rRNA (cytidine1920-2'-O)/16S rRNA (cytidine1409-2'-O)-methyltransferase
VATRLRLDRALVLRGVAPTRARAQLLVAAGAVTVDGEVARRPAQPVGDDQAIAVSADPLPWVSRGALKLLHALDAFGLSPEGAVALDLGASTGGFTEVLLARGAREVWAVDVGRDQLAPALRADPRVRVREGVNVRDLVLGPVPPPAFVTADLSFISLVKALPPALDLAAPDAVLVALVKPQFEVGPDRVGKGGIVRDAEAIAAARAAVRSAVEAAGWQTVGETESPIRGGDGNREFLLAACKRRP